MFSLYSLIAIVQSFSISLGVGASTIAIISFFVAIADGTIDPKERQMMGVTYTLLRIAMVAILATTLALLFLDYGALSNFSIAQLSVIAVLFINAVLMTAKIMPKTFGPAIQAGSWYTLGILAALVPLQLTGFSVLQFALSYITWLVLAVSIVNGVMASLKHKRNA